MAASRQTPSLHPLSPLKYTLTCFKRPYWEIHSLADTLCKLANSAISHSLYQCKSESEKVTLQSFKESSSLFQLWNMFEKQEVGLINQLVWPELSEFDS